MVILKVCYLAAIFIIVWADEHADTGCVTPDGKIMEAGSRHVEACLSFYMCDVDSQLHTYPACRIRPKCDNPRRHRDFNASKPWPQCCELDIC